MKRTELHSSPSPDARSPSPAPRLSFEYELIDATSQSGNADLKDGGEEGVSFRLFSSSAPTHRVTICSPAPVSKGDGGFVVRHRPRGDYFAEPALRRHEYAQVALAGQDVISRAESTRWPGAEMSWRVIYVPDARLAQKGRVSTEHDVVDGDREGSRGRVRKGKKARIKTRKMYAAKVLKAETEKEKRTRRNREKKVKKKAREKVKKLGGKEKVQESDLRES